MKHKKTYKNFNVQLVKCEEAMSPLDIGTKSRACNARNASSTLRAAPLQG